MAYANDPDERNRITIVVSCAECPEVVAVPWGPHEYQSILYGSVTLDGNLELPPGWWSEPGIVGGDNTLRCPKHSRQYKAAGHEAEAASG